MLQAILDTLGDLTAAIGIGAARILVCLMVVVGVFPVLVVLSCLGYAWGWYFFHAVLFSFTLLATVCIITRGRPAWMEWIINFFPGWISTGWRIVTGVLACAIAGLGVFNTTKPLAAFIGLLPPTVSLIAIGLYAFIGVSAIEIGIALTPGATVEEARARSRETLRSLFVLAAWGWFAAFTVAFYGQDLSLPLGLFLAFSWGIIFLAVRGWGMSGRTGQYLVFYGFSVGFITAISYLTILVLDRFGLWENLIGPFAIAMVPIGLCLAFWWLRRAHITRSVLFVIGIYLVFRGIDIHIPDHYPEEFFGLGLHRVFLVEPDIAGSHTELYEEARAHALQRDLTALDFKYRKKYPTPQVMEEWKKEINRVRASYHTYSPDDPLVKRIWWWVTDRWEKIRAAL